MNFFFQSQLNSLPDETRQVTGHTRWWIDLIATVHQQKNTEDYKERNLESVKKYQNKVQFPPEVLSKNLQHKIITGFGNDTSPAEFEESGCAICGKLTLIKDLWKKSELDLNIEILKQKGVSQRERKSSNDSLEDLNGPIIEDNLDNICNLCYRSVSKGKLP